MIDLLPTSAIVLAGGDGRRIRELSVDDAGRPVPKQFWKFDGRRSLLRMTLQRLHPLVPTQRTVPVVAAGHVLWWRRELDGVPYANIFAQPSNRGTATGILLPLLRILKRDSRAIVVVAPCDHWVDDETALQQSILAAIDQSRRDPDRVHLLGMQPESYDRDYGWIVPRRSSDLPSGPDGFPAVWPVESFEEKPSIERARQLQDGGALLNSMICVAPAMTFLQLFEKSLPRFVGQFVGQAHNGLQDADLVRVYAGLDVHDFSREVLQTTPEMLSVMTVPSCGWTDVGVPHRVARRMAG